MNRGSAGLFSANAFDVDDPLFTVNGSDFTLTGLVHASCDQNFIVLANGHGSDSVSGLQFLGQVGRHELSSGLRVGTKVSLAGLAARRRDFGVELHTFVVVVYMYKVYKETEGQRAMENGVSKMMVGKQRRDDVDET